MAAAGLDHAGDDRVPVVADHAGLVAQQAGADPVWLPVALPRDQVRIGDLRPCHLRQVGGPVVQRPLRLPGVHHAALQDHRDGAGHRGPDLPAQLDAVPRLSMQIRPGSRHRVDRPAHYHEIVHLPGQPYGLLGGHFRGHPSPGGQFVAAQPQPEHPPSSERLPHRAQHALGKQQPVLAVIVAALVGQPRLELAQQRVLAGVDLDPVQPGSGRQGGGSSEALDQRVDLRALHLHGQLARSRVWYPRRCPQRGLGERRGALHPSVPQPGQHQCAMWPAGRDGPGPARPALGSQRCALVGPVRGVHARGLGHDDAAAPRRPPGVVGDVPRRDLPAPAEVGLVRPEHHPARRTARPEVNGLGQDGAHAVTASGLESQSFAGARTAGIPSGTAWPR